MALKLADQRYQNVIYRLGGERYERFIHVFLGWKKLVGSLLAERSHPVKLENSVLFVGVQNSAWMQELILLKPDILKKYKSQFGEDLQDIIFIIRTQRKRKK
jgi:predicted nucleic acid-binding Zn ribbon protein